MKRTQATVSLVLGVAVARALAQPAWNASTSMSVNWSVGPFTENLPGFGTTVFHAGS